MLTLEAVARIQYVQFFGIAAGIWCFPNKFFTDVLLHALPVDNYESFFKSAFCAHFLMMGFLFVALEQYSTAAAKRKVLLYSIGGYCIAAVTQFLLRKEEGVVVFAYCFTNILLSASAYMHKEKLMEKEDRSSLHLALKGTSIFLLGSAALHYYVNYFPGVFQLALKPPNGLTSNLYFTRMLMSLRCAVGFSLMGAAQLAKEDMKKTLQYATAIPLLTIVLFISHIDLFTKEGANINSSNTLNLTLFAYAYFPSSCTKTVLQFFYFSYFTAAFYCLTKTHEFLENTMPWLNLRGNEQVGKVFGLQLMATGFLCVAVSLCDDTVHQIYLRFALLGHLSLTVGLYYYLHAVDPWSILSSILIVTVLFFNRSWRR